MTISMFFASCCVTQAQKLLLVYLGPPQGVREAHFQQAYKHCFIAINPSQTYENYWQGDNHTKCPIWNLMVLTGNLLLLLNRRVTSLIAGSSRFPQVLRHSRAEELS